MCALMKTNRELGELENQFQTERGNGDQRKFSIARSENSFRELCQEKAIN